MRKSMLVRGGLMMALVAGLATWAEAAPVSYDFSYQQTAVSPFSGGTGAGDFSGQFSVDGGQIVGIAGTSSLFGAITGLVPPGGFPIGAENSNAFGAASPWIDEYGVSFTTATRVINLSWDPSEPGWDGLAELLTGGGSTAGTGNLVVTLAALPGPLVPVAEPATLGLFGLGLLGLAAAGRRRADQLHHQGLEPKVLARAP